MITDLWIENFKGIGKRQHIPLRPITLLFGANNAGKSTVLLSLLYLREIVENQDCDPEVAKFESSIEFGGFGNMAHIDERGFRSNMIRIGCRVSLQENEATDIIQGESFLGAANGHEVAIVGEMRSATVHLNVSRGKNKQGVPVVTSTEIAFNDQLVCRITVQNTVASMQLNAAHPLLWTPELAWLSRPLEKYLAYEGNYFRFIETTDRGEMLEFLELQRDFSTFVSLHGMDRLFEPYGLDGMPKSGIFAVVPFNFFCELKYGPDEDGDEHEFYESVLIVFDSVSEEWIVWGLFGAGREWEDEEAYAAIEMRRHLLEGCENFLNAEVSRVLNNCWHSMPTPNRKVSLGQEVSGVLQPAPHEITQPTEAAPTGIKRDALLNVLLRLPIIAIQNQLRVMTHIGPKRRDVPRTLSTQTAWGLTSWRDGSAAWTTLLECDDSIVQHVSSWLNSEKFLNAGVELRRDSTTVVDAEAKIRMRRMIAASENVHDASAELDVILAELPTYSVLRLYSGRKILQLQDVGEGITQVVPILVAQASLGGLLTVEQPELHLHPSIQTGLADVLLQVLKHRDNGKLLIETHSEHLILRILRRIRQTTDGELPEHIPPVKPDDVCVLWVDNLGDGTTFTRLRIDERGEFIDRWPKGFFSERAEELY